MERKDFIKTITAGGILATAAGCSTGTGTDGGGLYNAPSAEPLRNAAEREAVAIQTYTAAAGYGIIEDEDLLDALVRFRSHHRQHLAEFNRVLEGLGYITVDGDRYDPDGRVADVQNQEDAVELAMKLEWEAAIAYYEQLIGQNQNPETARLLANIFPVEVSHYVSLKEAMGITPALNSGLFLELDDDHAHG